MSVYLPKPLEAIPIVLFIVSFTSCSLVGLSAAIRSKNFLHLFHLNPVKQFRAHANTYLNGVEKVILIYAIAVIAGGFLGMIFAPVIGPLVLK
jgi:hypothetical protein